jgi:NAD(P)-dependent dehydrogenase (short-subunit alcohol dehydrogenase family)
VTFDGKVAVITGGAAGIGRALGRALVGQGCSVVLADVDTEALCLVADELKALGGNVLAVASDVADPAAVDELAAQAVQRFGAVDLAVANAGVCRFGRPLEFSLEDWRWMVDVNLWGVVNAVRSFLPLLVEAGDGKLLITASMASLIAIPDAAPYVMTKHAVLGLADALRADVAHDGLGVQVTTLMPGFVRTQIFNSELHRPGGPRPPSGREEAFQARLHAKGADPNDVAFCALEALEAGQPYVFTDAAMAEYALAERVHTIGAAIGNKSASGAE